MLIDGNLIEIHAHGSLTRDSAEASLKLMQELYAQYGNYFVLLDLNDADPLPPGLRRYMAEAINLTPPFATGGYGLAVIKRAMLALIMGASKLVTGSAPNMALFKTESEARAWLETQWRGRRVPG